MDLFDKIAHLRAEIARLTTLISTEGNYSRNCAMRVRRADLTDQLERLGA